MNAAAKAFWSVVKTSVLPDLGSGPREVVLPSAELSNRLDLALKGFPISEESMTRLRAAALLYHDQHDSAHDLVQDLTDDEGALIHALLHRREPDFWNAKYWFRRVVNHPIFSSLEKRIRNLTKSPAEIQLFERLCPAGALDPFAMIDACESLKNHGEATVETNFLKLVQHAEFEALVDHLLA